MKLLLLHSVDWLLFILPLFTSISTAHGTHCGSNSTVCNGTASTKCNSLSNAWSKQSQKAYHLLAEAWLEELIAWEQE
jgi:MFS-type transporter involved in bile tolerance (Atg22 family)